MCNTVTVCGSWAGKVARLPLDLRHIVSNFQQIEEMLMVNAVMASVFEMGQGFHEILSQQHIISNFQQIKDMLLVNVGMPVVFDLGQGFHEI
jgi:hypothetical protein